MPKPEECRWLAVFDLLARPWFERVWVQQEIVMSDARQARLQCGDEEIPWLWLEYTLYAIRWAAEQLPESVAVSIYKGIFDTGRPRIPLVLEVFAQLGNFRPDNPQQPNPSVELALRSYRALKAGDARDNVFALIGMAVDVDTQPVQVDYRRSVEETYRITTAGLLQHYHLDLLSATGLQQQGNLKGLPTWVIDWTYRLFSRPLTDSYGLLPYRASACSPHAGCKIEGTSIRVRGLVVDEVASLIPPCMPDETKGLNAYEVAFARWMNDIRDLLHDSDIDMNHDSIWRTIVADVDYENRPAPESFKEGFLAIVKLFNIWEQCDYEPSKMDNRADADEYRLVYRGSETVDLHPFSSASRTRVFSRSFGITRRGRTALLPRTTKAGDVVVLLQGAKIAYVLRPVHEGRYQLVGEAYVHGIMYGEAWPDDDEGIQQITLI